MQLFWSACYLLKPTTPYTMRTRRGQLPFKGDSLEMYARGLYLYSVAYIHSWSGVGGGQSYCLSGESRHSPSACLSFTCHSHQQLESTSNFFAESGNGLQLLILKILYCKQHCHYYIDLLEAIQSRKVLTDQTCKLSCPHLSRTWQNHKEDYFLFWFCY